MKRDELNNLNINNTDGELHVEENSLKNIKEVQNVPEVQKAENEVFKASEEYKIEEDNGTQSFDNTSRTEDGSSSSSSTAGATGATATAGIVGGVVGVIAVSAVLVLGIVKLPAIPAVDVKLISASSSSLSFALNTNVEDHSSLTISLSSGEYIVSTPFQEYVKFSNLKQNEVYTLSVFDAEKSHYSSNFYFEDEMPGEKVYTVNVKNSAGVVVFSDETFTPREYEMDNFIEDVAIFVSVNGELTAGVQVYKPIYDYENIHWIWGEYGDTVTAIIPSTNETDDYYVRDIRNFEIDREEPTCTKDGFVIRQAAFIGPDKNRYEDEKEFVLPALGHDFSDVTYTWSDHYHTCKAESECPHCHSKIEESVEVEIEDIQGDISYKKYTATFANENFSTRYHFEDLTYGRYPQSKVSDTSIISELDQEYGTPLTLSDKWTSYDYYASGSLTSYMYYVDVDIDDDAEFDYRGVYFTSYRPIDTTDPLGNSSYQYDNGYLINTTYWFSYDPIEWDVLDQGNNQLFITSKVILDSQSYYHELGETEFAHNGGSGYANNYELSDIRLWLNNEFYNSAFGGSDAVITTTVNNSLESTLDSSNSYICEDTEDKVFLLSRADVNEYLSANSLSASGSDYAKCQGLYVALQDDKGFWGLRTPYPEKASQIRYITNNGTTTYDSNDKTSLGVRPACWISLD